MRTDDRLPKPQSLWLVTRGRMLPREMHSSPFDGMPITRTPLDPIEDRSQRGLVYRVLSTAAWPSCLCIVEASLPDTRADDDASARGQYEPFEQRPPREEHQELTKSLLVANPGVPPQHLAVLAQYIVQAQERLQEIRQRSVEQDRKEERRRARRRPRVIVDFSEIRVRQVPEEFLDQARRARRNK